nr:serine/threonine-protein kinase [Kofleriaceae bacterium]
ATLAKRIALLPNVIAVTEAIAYAHAEKVIHRDLKPANVLVGKFGETVVIDWGLAKDLAAADDGSDADGPDAAESVSVGPFREPTGGLSDATAAGKVMGTPAYMPLEQARGEAIDARADVYALGAMLYHLLAGTAPYAKVDEGGVPWETMLARVLAGPPESLAARAPDAPPDLVAIVDHAMARTASARYATAGELAEDLRRFEMGQLVGAHRYSTWQLVQRWLRKHRGAVTVGAILVAVLAAVSIVSVQRIRHERSDAEAARAVAEEQRGLAVASRNDAEDLIGFMLGELKDKLKPVGKLDILDPVVAKTLAYYDKRPADADDADERAKRAQAFMNVGDVRQPEGNLPGALDAYRKALALEPTSAPAQLAAAHTKIGDVLYYQNDSDGALAEYRTALAIADQAAAASPTDDDIAHARAVAHSDIGDVERDRGHPDDANTDYRAGLAVRQEVVARSPTDDHERALAKAYVNLARGLWDKGTTDDALPASQSALDIYNKLIARDPKNTIYQREIAVTHGFRGDIFVKMSKIEDALAEYRAAVAIDDALVARDPTNTDWLRDLMIVHDQTSSAYLVRRDAKNGLAEERIAVAVADRTATLDPTNAQWKRDRASSHQRLATQLRTVNQVEALAELALARDIYQQLSDADPNNVVYLGDLASVHNVVGNLYATSDDEKSVRASLPEFEAAATVYKQLTVKAPDSLKYLRAYANSLNNLGDNLASLGDPKAKEVYAEAIPIFEQLVAKVPSDNSSRQSLLVMHFNLGDMASKTDPAAAHAEYAKAEDYAKALLAADPKNPVFVDMAGQVDAKLNPKPKK